MALLKKVNNKAQTDNHSGFGTNANNYGGRFINKDGNPMARICTKYCRQRIARICNPCPHSKYLIPKSHFNNGVAFGFYNVAPLPEEFLQKSCANVPRSAKSSF